MFRSICRPFIWSRDFHTIGNSLKTQQSFSIVSVHSSFPATLFRFQPQRCSGLFDFQIKDNGDPDDGLLVSKDGLIYPRVSKDIPFSNGATFMPNTFMMQELTRTSFDQHTEDLENGHPFMDPLIFRIPRGTLIPSSLILFREHSSRFSLQPSGPMFLSDLNSTLNKFYSNYAITYAVEKWLDDNEYHMAIADNATADWMCE